MCTTSLSTRFLGSAHGTRETQTMQTSSILVDKAQQLAAAGRHTEAIGSWEIARAAFERAGWRQGVGECHHNLGITYREQGALDRALAEANRAVAEAEASGDHTLWALTLRGRAEIHVSRRELQLARRDLDQVRDLR